jgi:hypothetical protein
LGPPKPPPTPCKHPPSLSPRLPTPTQHGGNVPHRTRRRRRRSRHRRPHSDPEPLPARCSLPGPAPTPIKHPGPAPYHPVHPNSGTASPRA